MKRPVSTVLLVVLLLLGCSLPGWALVANDVRTWTYSCPDGRRIVAFVSEWAMLGTPFLAAVLSDAKGQTLAVETFTFAGEETVDGEHAGTVYVDVRLFPYDKPIASPDDEAAWNRMVLDWTMRPVNYDIKLPDITTSLFLNLFDADSDVIQLDFAMVYYAGVYAVNMDVGSGGWTSMDSSKDSN